jgi:hypothetical protein
MQVAKDTQFVTKQIETSKFVGEEGYQPGSYTVPVTRSPGFGAPLALGAFGALAVLVHIRRQKP